MSSLLRNKRRTWKRTRFMITNRMNRLGRSSKMLRGGYWYAPGKVQNQVHQFKRTCAIENIEGIGAGGYHRAFQFSVDQLPNYNELVNLYDSYKITSVTLRIEPAFDSNNMANPQILSQKFIRVVHDYDDATPLTAENDYFEYGNLKNYQCTRPFKVVLYPKVSAEIYRTALSTGYEQRSSPWLDMSATGVTIPHYGIKMYFPFLGIGESLQFRVIATFHISCRQSK